MEKIWKITVNGVDHEVGFKRTLFKSYKIVNGVETRIKGKGALSWFVQMIDEPIDLGGKTVHLTAVGNNFDLAVDDVYLDSKKAYVPLSSVPKWVTGFAIALLAIGFFMCGLIGLALGCLGAMLIIRIAVTVEYKNPLLLSGITAVVCIAIQTFIALLVNGWI